jgi:hypothetical protein
MNQQRRLADAFVMLDQNAAAFAEMRGAISSLRAVIATAGGDETFIDAAALNEMTALELIALIAPNGIRFCVAPPHP